MRTDVVGVNEVIFFFDKVTHQRESRAIISSDEDGSVKFAIGKIFHDAALPGGQRVTNITPFCFYSLRFDRDVKLFVGEVDNKQGETGHILLDVDGVQITKDSFDDIASFKNGVTVARVDVFMTLLDAFGKHHLNVGEYVSVTHPDKSGFFTALRLMGNNAPKVTMFRWFEQEQKVRIYSTESNS